MRARAWALLAAAFIFTPACQGESERAAPTASALPERAPSGLPLVAVEIRTDAGVHRFIAEVAHSPAEQARGLMFRERLGPDEAMLFPFQAPKRASFWMKNTPIPLDILFIRADGSIARIAARTEPYSLAPLLSDEPVAAVLEIRGGRAAELGIDEGDHVRW
ncbi:MAG: DUF192 domain-containing protein [Sphingomonadaceae bacterium]